MAGTSGERGFKGNKAHLPSKPCEACGRPMSWRRAWAKNWEQVKYCSDACRRGRSAGSVTPTRAGSAQGPAASPAASRGPRR
ncbi:MAG: DUF2256 domain-containing protein [Rubrivivax sp.]